jgi:hypothetical protein
MADTGFVLAGAGTFIAGAGADWANAGNITASDNTYATASVVGGESTDPLKGYTFGLSVPSGATIDGIEVQIEVKTNTAATISSVNVGKDDSTLATEKSPGTSITGSDATYAYGGASDKWGLTWTAAEVNASTFQLRFVSAAGGLGLISCDAVWIKVYYTQSVGAATGTTAADATSQATKKSTFSEAGTVAVAAIGAPTFKATGAVTASAAVAGRQGYLGVSAATSAVAGTSQATKKSPGLVSATAALDAVSNATKKSVAEVSASVAIDAVSRATKKSAGTVSASDTVAAVAATSGATKKSAAVVSENGSTVLALSSYKRGIRRPSALNDVTTPTTVTLHDIPAPVALAIQ